MAHLRIIDNEDLALDPDVQLMFALKPRQVAAIRADFNEDYAGVLIVVPAIPNGAGGQGPKYWIIDGRHRWQAGQGLVSRWRCDVHDYATTIEDKAKLKLANDRERRHVTPLEHYKIRLLAKDPTIMEIDEIVNEAGFSVGKLSANTNSHTIEAVIALEAVYRLGGPHTLRRALSLNTRWRDDPKANTADWIKAMGLLARDGYDEAMTPAAHKRLDAVVPAVEIRKARGLLETQSPGVHTQWGELAYVLANLIRKRARLRTRPIGVTKTKSSNSRPIK